MSSAVEVALVRWPRDRARRDELAGAMLPRLLLVAPGDQPPGGGDDMEDWIRLPADERDVAARLQVLAERAARSLDETVVVDARCLRRGTHTVSLSPSEAAFAGVLVASPGALVSRAALASSIWGSAARAGDGALDDVAYRLRKRVAPLGLDVVTARGRGFALHVQRPIHAGMVE